METIEGSSASELVALLEEWEMLTPGQVGISLEAFSNQNSFVESAYKHTCAAIHSEGGFFSEQTASDFCRALCFFCNNGGGGCSLGSGASSFAQFEAYINSLATIGIIVKAEASDLVDALQEANPDMLWAWEAYHINPDFRSHEDQTAGLNVALIQVLDNRLTSLVLEPNRLYSLRLIDLASFFQSPASLIKFSHCLPENFQGCA